MREGGWRIDQLLVSENSALESCWPCILINEGLYWDCFKQPPLKDLWEQCVTF